MDIERLKDALFGNKERVLTAIVLLAVLSLVLIFNNYYLIWGVLGVVYLVGMWESFKLFSIFKDRYLLLGIGVATWLLLLAVPKIEVILFLPLLLVVSYKAYKYEEMRGALPFIYPTIPMLLFFELYRSFGLFAVVWLIVIVSLTDTFAYFSGKYFGKRKFTPTSPNKTIEGVIGGVVVGTIIGSLFGLYFVDIKLSFSISLLASLFSVFGDLFESYLKREAGVKDSGAIFPGHGGVLDRLDGYLFAVVVLYGGLILQ